MAVKYTKLLQKYQTPWIYQNFSLLGCAKYTNFGILKCKYVCKPSGNPEDDISYTGLPDGLFLIQKSQFGKILEGLRLKKMDVFYGRLEYFTTIWYILC
jgi:hypothetical protein